MRRENISGFVLTVVILASVLVYGKTSFAFESLPNSLTYQVIDTSKQEMVAGVPTYYVQPGQLVSLTVTLRNRSTNPAGEVWYGRQDILSEGSSYPNAHAIGLGTSNPRDSRPAWIDPTSFVINGNRFMYYSADAYGVGGGPIYKGHDVVLHFQVKISNNAQPSTYSLYLAPVREFDNWGVRVTSTGAKYKYQDILWHFEVQGQTSVSTYSNTRYGYSFDYDKAFNDPYGVTADAYWMSDLGQANKIMVDGLTLDNYTANYAGQMTYVHDTLSDFANKIREINANDSNPNISGKTVSPVQSGYLNTIPGFYFDISKSFTVVYDMGSLPGTTGGMLLDSVNRFWAFQDKSGNNYLLNYPLSQENLVSRILNTIHLN